MRIEELFRNILLGIMLAAPIGPAGVAVIQGGLRWGFRRAFLTGLGITSADLSYMLVVYFGLAGFIQIPAVKIGLWLLGAAVLIYLGVQNIREGGRQIDFQIALPSPSRPPFVVGYLVNISNPIAVVFWLGIFGSLISGGSNDSLGLLALLQGLSILTGILTWHTSMSLLTHWGKQFLNQRSARIISLIAGAALLLFGLRFIYQAVQTLFG